MYKVTFKFEHDEDIQIEAPEDETLLQTAKKANVAIDAPCSGNGSCGKCRVRLLSGMLDSPASRHISSEEYADGYRLACTSRPQSDVQILVPDIASAYKSRMKIADLSSYSEVRIFNQTWQQIEKAGIAFKNDYELCSLQLDVPSFEDTLPDDERITRALKEKYGAAEAGITYYAMKKLPDVLRARDFSAELIIKHCGSSIQVLDILAENEHKKAYVLVADIGTTTVSALLVNLIDGKIAAKASSGNAQIRYGADVINRIIESAKPGGRQKLMDAVINETLNIILDGMCSESGADPNQIYAVYTASNTTMNHLFLGLNADYLRQEPFIPVFFHSHKTSGGDLGLHVNPHAEVVIAPNIGSYVGGDITAGTLASLIWDKEEFSLFIDLGTNGEVVFGCRDFLIACACSAGPAFEGGDISSGMRATDGAIERITIDKESTDPSFEAIGDCLPVGICGSGLIDLISELFLCGIINSKGKFIRESDRILTDSYGISRYVVVCKEDAGAGKEISVSEIDIDNFIRAKGAIFSAINIMLESVDMPIDVIENVYVAGGIGSGINMKNAVSIGMFPDIDLSRYHYIGNSSLSGIYCMAMSVQAHEKVNHIASNMTYLELSNEAGYMDEFIAACFLPHTNEKLFPSVQLR